MSNRRRRSLEVSFTGGATGFSIFYKEESSNLAVKNDILFFQDTWGYRVKEYFLSIREITSDGTPADAYNRRNVCGPYSWIRAMFGLGDFDPNEDGQKVALAKKKMKELLDGIHNDELER